MKYRRSILARGLAALVMFGLGSATHAYTFAPSQWPQPETTFYVGIPGGALWNTTFEDAMAQWSGDTVFNYLIVRYEFRDPCDSPGSSPPARNGVDMAITECGDAWGSGVLAVTSSWSQNGVRIQAGVIFNATISWSVYSGAWQYPVADLRRVAMHELGHALGLDHEDGPPAIMSTYVGNIENPTSDDIAGVLALYGPPPDTDGDGVPDGSDNCTLLANPGQCDSDGDGYGNRCDADLNNNGVTNAFDTPLFRAQIGMPSVAPIYNAADLNCNGSVNSFDTPILRALLGAPPGPSGVAP